jgi:hypothetical protein
MNLTRIVEEIYSPSSSAVRPISQAERSQILVRFHVRILGL